MKSSCCSCCWAISVVSDSVRPHRRQPTRLCHPWDSPGKNTGVGCHFLLQCMKVKSQSEVAQSCLTLCDHMDSSPPGSSVHGILQEKVLEWVAIAFSGSQLDLYFAWKNWHVWFYPWWSDVRIGCECTDVWVGPLRRLSTEELMLSNCGVRED